MKLLKILVAFWLTLILAACGGGGGDSGDPPFGGGGDGGTDEVPTVTVSVTPNSAVSATAPATVTAQVLDAAGNAISGVVVNFSTSADSGSFSANGALTDASGVAAVTLTPSADATSGADEVIATVALSGTEYEGRAGYSFVASSVDSATISVKLSSTTVTAANPATVTANVKSAGGAGVAGIVVRFSTVDALGAFSAASALTDASGNAVVTLTPASSSTSGADEVVASATIGDTALQASAGFQLTATNVGIASFTSDLGAGSLSAYGQTTLTLRLSGAPDGTPVNLSVSSTCVTKGRATITPLTQSTTNGRATFTYVDDGCGVSDASDTVQAAIVGTAVSRSLAVDLTPPNLGSLAFISATPEKIFLKGSGYDEVSVVTFEVRDDAGNALPGQSVRMEPTTLAGGLTLDSGSGSVTKVSDSNGRVAVRVNSGTVPTPVRVKATVVGSGISTVSSSLAVAVGLPAQLRFSLSQETPNIEGLDFDGTTNTYTVIASDRVGNPVPTGTTINFVAEGSQIGTAAQTALDADGLASASVGFLSAAPRPIDGRITIVAYALGEESFLDRNGNNVYDAGEGFQDLGDVFMSRRYLKDYSATFDEFISLSITGSEPCVQPTGAQDPADLLGLNATIPSRAGTCDGVWGRAYVRAATETVLSASTSRPVWPTPPKCSVIPTSRTIPIDSVGGTKLYYLVDGSALYEQNKSGSITFLVSDSNNNRLNPVAAGSVISATGEDGFAVSVLGGSPVPGTTNPNAAAATVKWTFDDQTVAGTMSIGITSPRGVTTTLSVFISQGNAPSSTTFACP